MAKKKYKLEQLLQLYQNLNKLGDLKGTDFAICYAEAKHALVKIFDDVYVDLTKVRNTEAFIEYGKAEEALAKTFIELGEDGRYKELSKEKEAEMVKALEDLREKPEYKDITEQFKVELEKVQNKIKEGEVEIALKQIPFKKLPAEITADQIFSIKELVLDLGETEYATSLPKVNTNEEYEVVEEIQAMEV
jgi:hypothetical protein